LQTFEQLGLSAQVLKVLGEIGFEKPTEIQEKAIPVLLEKNADFIGLAATGTGKTAAFGLPLLEHINIADKHVSALILAPTRELAQQIAKELIVFSKYIQGFRIEVVYGGANISTQIRSLKKAAPHVLVATPGRLQDLIDRKSVSLEKVRWMILDEADEMLNMGFQEAVDQILEYTPEEKNIWLFSATMPPEIRKIVHTYMESPAEVKIHSDSKANVNIEHKYIYVHKSDKPLALKRVLDYLTDFYGVIFCKTKLDTQELADYLEKEGYRAEALHGDLSQNQRDAVMAKFRNKSTPILVATDVAARGIDVDSLTHVVHYSLPDNPEYYTHRSGRTARAGKKGTSLAIVTPQDIGRIRFFEKTIGVQISHIKVPLRSQMYSKRLEKFTEKLLQADTIELTDEVVDKAMHLIGEMSREELVRKIIALEFNKLYKKVERDDLNILIDADQNRRKDKHRKDDKKSRGEQRHGGDFERRSDRGRSRGDENRSVNAHNDIYYINLGKIDHVHPVNIVDLISTTTGITKKSIGDIDMFKKHSLIQIDKRMSRKLEENAKHMKFKGRKITVKREVVQ